MNRMNVFYEESGHFKAAEIKTENPGSLHVVTTSGKQSKIKLANVLLHFDEPLDRFISLAQDEAETLDTDFLWECCDQNEFGFEDLAQAYYGDAANNIQKAATAIKIHAAPVYFYRKGKGRYKAAPEETLKQALAALERKAQQAVQMAEWVKQLNNNQLPAGFAEKAQHLLYKPDKNSLEWKAIDTAAQASKRLPIKVMHAAGLIESVHDYHLGAFLYDMFPNGTDFPNIASIQDQINTATADLPVSAVEAFSIDDATTNEIDDAFSLTKLDNGNHRIGIHIAVPALGVEPNSELDTIVMDRLSTVYMPGHKITMLPEAVVRPFSLDEGHQKPAISLYVEVTPDLAIVAHESKLDLIHVSDNLRHDALEPFFNADTLDEDSGHPFWPKLKLLHDFAVTLEKARGKYDPDRAPQIDYNFYVTNGIVDIVPRERGAPIDKLVAELMIYANSTWGGLLKQAGFAGIYRAQTDGKVFMTMEAKPHQGMGLEQYAWCTSPLRRAVDLINQRQLIAAITQQLAPYSAGDTLKSIMRNFDQTYQTYNEFQTRMERYWCLQYLVQEKVEEVKATVWRESLVRIDGMFYLTKVSQLPTLKPGAVVQIGLKNIDLLLIELESRFIEVLAGDAD